MSNEELKNLPSVAGYLNFVELRTAILRGLGVGSMTALGLTLLTVVLENASSIYVGPGAAIVVSLASTVAALIRANNVGKRFLKEGE